MKKTSQGAIALKKYLSTCYGAGAARRLAKRLGIGETTLSRMLSGHRPPSLIVAVKIYDECGIPVSWWVQ